MQGFGALWQGVRHEHAVVNSKGLTLYTLPSFCKIDDISHGFSTREGGVSAPPYASLNLSFTRPNEKKETVLENYRLFCDAFSIPFESMVMDSFEHGTAVRRVDGTHTGSGYIAPPLPPCDGLVTNVPGVTLVTGHADCMALYFVDPVRHAIGLAHAGWKGAFGKIGSVVIQALQENYGSDPEDIIAGVGPCICQKHFEVDAELGDRFTAAFPGVPCTRPGRPNKAHVNLAMVAAAQCLEAGLLPQNITLMDVCTYEAADLYSYRGDQGQTGGMAAFLRLLP
ncbi:MAG: peptidoglycan editing factor PgeF [Eubacteriales bacterium]|nr:peptidoglycan editing factor PgeF [Eubacteriales bacterium]